MPTHDAGDEFDQLPDYIDFAAIRDEDWNTMQSLASDTSIPEFVQGSSSARTQDSPVPEYFLDDDDVFDDVFLRHVDVLEEQILNRSRPQKSVASTESSTQISAEHKAYPRDSLKRPRQDSPHPVQSNRLDDDWSELLGDWDEELTCPVCFDVLAAAHLLNGCGHTMCGSCAYEWVIEKHHNTCPVCRTRCHALKPMLSNIIIDNVVQKYLRMQAMLGDQGWKVGGSKLSEWQTRKDKWKDDCVSRSRKLNKESAFNKQ